MTSAAEQFVSNLNFGAFAKATELKKRIWFTLGALLVYRMGLGLSASLVLLGHVSTGLRAGGIVVLPTDTVYGIAVALATPGGIERLFHVKQRPPEKAIALLLADADQAGELGLVSPAAAALAAALWPGPLTLVLPIEHAKAALS